MIVQAGVLSALGQAGPAAAFFESQEQLAVSAVATAQPKVTSMVAEVAEVARKRAKGVSADFEDDAPPLPSKGGPSVPRREPSGLSQAVAQGLS